MSIAPDTMTSTLSASGPRGAPYAIDHQASAEPHLAEPVIRDVTRVRLAPGDRLVVHVDGAQGMSPGGAHELAVQLATRLKLDELGFDVPIIIAAPGMRLEVLHP